MTVVKTFAMDNDDGDSSSSFSEYSDTLGGSFSESRDEVREINKMSKKENFLVRSWRLAVTGILLMTAVAVTGTTYHFLNEEEYHNFEIAYDQFSRTVGDAAIEQQRNVRDSLESMANAISVLAESNNAIWPMFYVPKFESYAEDYIKLSRAEYIGINNIVQPDERESYIEWSTQHYEDWTKEGHMMAHGNLDLLDTNPAKYNAFVSKKTKDGFVPDIERKVYAVRTTQSPPPRAYGPLTNINIGALSNNQVLVEEVLNLRNETLITWVKPYNALPADEHLNFHSDSEADHPHSFFFHPVHKEAQNYNSDIVAILNSGIAWDASMLNLLPDNVEGIFCVIKNSCDQAYSYEIVGKDAIYQGEGDLHDLTFNDKGVEVNLALHTHPNFTSSPNHCRYTMHIYPSERFRESYNSNTPEIFAAAVAATFGLVALVFFVYDVMVQQRNEKIINNAAHSNAIVSSLFPGMFRDRLLNQGAESSNNTKKGASNLKSFLEEDGSDVEKDGQGEMASKPLADLFLETTVIFADIVGFTAWSSIREPSQVFTLLETVYSQFDKLAKRGRVYKIETVGDCYVAVTGLPEPRSDHAVVMARFARACMNEMVDLTKKLEVTLGPDTGELSLRIGIHSGPVTAGVLRGERSRFQLFGDTMNTTARIESSGLRGKIHVSEATAKLLIDGGKESWIKAREDRVVAKGKGYMDTYWLTLQRHDDCSTTEGGSSQENYTMEANSSSTRLEGITKLGETDSDVDNDGTLDERINRLIDWNSGMLLPLIQQIIARRTAKSASNKISSNLAGVVTDGNLNKATMPLEEVKEIITLPAFDRKTARRQQDPETVEVPAAVKAQLRDYITCIAKMYNGNSFHSFDHASHVVMSVIKLMSRIVLPKDIVGDSSSTDQDSIKGDSSRGGSKSTKYVKATAASLHDHTYGITSDPLTQFACAFSALIHDVDHTGVPNPRLIEENPELSAVYRGRSVAEQNSLDISWSLLMEDRYKDLRAALCSDEDDLSRFRQLVVNSVMATDLGDKELKELRNNRWDKAFKKEDSSTEKSDMPVFEIGTNENYRDAVNRKATIVIEHLIQASDVSHTMQHWHVYRKWNERLFMEMYDAYKNGRSTTNPAEFWYKGEIGFFDFYIIPLAKKLKECGVFGISSDEFLNYATSNRAEWEARGQEVVAEMMIKIENEAASLPS